MKKFITICTGFVFLALLFYMPGVFSISISEKNPDPCKWPLTYSIEYSDPRFGVTNDQLLSALDEVENLWSEPFNQPVLKRSQDGMVKVYLIFDDRQETTINRQRKSEQLEHDQRSYEHLVSRRRMLTDRYDLENDQYIMDNRNYERLISEFNQKVAAWNRDGGAPPEAVEELKGRQEEIDRKRADIMASGLDLQKLADEIDELTDHINKFIGETNKRADSFNREFTMKDPFKQGEYVHSSEERTINIYQFNDLNQLRLVLAHEFGHALGLGHVNNPESLMHEITNDRNTASELRLTREDLEAFREVCEHKL